jgi:hypothetical protein
MELKVKWTFGGMPQTLHAAGHPCDGPQRQRIKMAIPLNYEALNCSESYIGGEVI